jgi:Mrp family chromosome partitioning ATPase
MTNESRPEDSPDPYGMDDAGDTPAGDTPAGDGRASEPQGRSAPESQLVLREGGRDLQHRDRHHIVEKRLVQRDKITDLSKHLRSVSAAVNAYVIEKGTLILAVFGSQDSEGTSTVARELAISLAVSPTNSVLLVDGNAGDGDQGRYFGVTAVESLWSAARGGPVRTTRLQFPLGGMMDLAALAIDNARDATEVDLRLLPQLFERLRRLFNVVIIDCPPALTAAGYVSTSALADSCLLVVEANRTRVPVVRRAMEEIEAAGGKLQGLVLNKRKHYIPSWIYRRI